MAAGCGRPGRASRSGCGPCTAARRRAHPTGEVAQVAAGSRSRTSGTGSFGSIGSRAGESALDVEPTGVGQQRAVAASRGGQHAVEHVDTPATASTIDSGSPTPSGSGAGRRGGARARRRGGRQHLAGSPHPTGHREAVEVGSTRYWADLARGRSQCRSCTMAKRLGSPRSACVRRGPVPPIGAVSSRARSRSGPTRRQRQHVEDHLTSRRRSSSRWRPHPQWQVGSVVGGAEPRAAVVQLRSEREHLEPPESVSVGVRPSPRTRARPTEPGHQPRRRRRSIRWWCCQQHLGAGPVRRPACQPGHQRPDRGCRVATGMNSGVRERAWRCHRAGVGPSVAVPDVRS